ncbi:hypothetical protein BC936DRAFT_148521 [Jimgerdemannia flammicorona]|uniref:Uncharacterized protein n=2 Tax=Jimgerdemannia flammicorona TaxID=994334 RepID=A0A433D2W0_9FUNG|nr:hypothetical protein BC936DRAFT_148521 [Jimgerdemannia flammicorona]RUS30937.1 hypothetical protein BC938DRAFT_478733 [Jimgerdemannia flammicorona]
MILEERLLRIQGPRNGLLSVNIALPTIHDWDITEPKRDDPARQDVYNVGALVHQVNLSKNTNGASALRVDLARKLQTVGVGEISVSSSDSKNDGVGLCDVFDDHFADLLLDILGLITNGNLRIFNVQRRCQ